MAAAFKASQLANNHGSLWVGERGGNSRKLRGIEGGRGGLPTCRGVQRLVVKLFIVSLAEELAILDGVEFPRERAAAHKQSTQNIASGRTAGEKISSDRGGHINLRDIWIYNT